jgi:hypothetical protein
MKAARAWDRFPGMVQALLVLAADEAEPSKSAFYICGGLLAAWAVVLAGIGLSRPAFPENAVAARGVMTISAVLVVATMAMAVVTA